MLKKMVVSLMSVSMVFLLFTNMTSAATKYEEKTVMYACNANALYIINVNFDMPVTIRSQVPESVTPGEQFNMEESSATAAIPEQTVATLKNALNWNEVSGNISRFDVHSTNIDKTVNAASGGIAIPPTPIPSSGDLVFHVPADGTLTVGSFQAGQQGDVTFTAGQITASFKNPNGGFFSPIVNASCTPKVGEDHTLTKVPILN